jgi:hypothetical protein
MSLATMPVAYLRVEGSIERVRCMSGGRNICVDAAGGGLAISSIELLLSFFTLIPCIFTLLFHCYSLAFVDNPGGGPDVR